LLRIERLLQDSHWPRRRSQDFLQARAERERAGSNAEWLRLLAEKAQADLDRRNEQRRSA
jgi:hypothetical protein